MCSLYSITANQAAIAALYRVVNRYVGNLAPMPGVLPDYPAPVIRNTDSGTELAIMRWGMHPPPRTGGPPVTNIKNVSRPSELRAAGTITKKEHLRPATRGNRLSRMGK
jgi:putative SOS response-associated peptidase YedK